MKLKSFTTFALLFVLSFSIMHGYIYNAHDDDHNSVIEYISEFDTPSSHDNLCDIHSEYHQSFLLSQILAI